MESSSDRNIRDHLWRWSTYFSRTAPTDICRFVSDKSVHCPTSLHLCREFGKRIKYDKSPIPLVWPGLIGKCRSIFTGHWHNGDTPHVTRFRIFWRESFRVREKRLAARGSRLAK